MRQGVLGFAASLALAAAAPLSFAATTEAAVASFAAQRQAALEQEAADLEASWPVPEAERVDWERRLRALRRELEFVEREQARAGLRQLAPLQAQASRLQSALTTGVAPSETQAMDCGVARPDDAPGRIAGQVRRADNNAGVASAGIVIWSCTGSIADVTSTDATGAYSTAATLQPGRYYVSVDGRDGLVGEIFPDVTCFACAAREVGAPVVVTAGATTSGVDFSLAAGSVLQGSVREAGGAGISAVVYAATREGHSVFLGSTNAAGDFSSLPGVPAGDYVVFTYASANYVDECYPDLACLHASWFGDAGLPYVTASGSSPVTGLNFVLAPGGRVTGTVTDSGSAPLASALVTVATESGDTRCSAATDASGVYDCHGLLAGSYLMRVSKAGYVTELFFDIPCVGCSPRGGNQVSVTTGGTTTVNFTLSTEATISGTLRDGTGPGALPVAGATVTAYGYRASALTSAPTDAGGNYTLRGLVPGNYQLRASAPGFLPTLYPVGPCPGCALTATNTTVAIPSAGAVITGRDMVMAREAPLSGTITAAVSGQPLAGVGVLAYDVTGRLLGSTSTNCNGLYTISGLEAGAYYLQTTNTLGYVNEAAGNVPCWTCAPATGALVTLSTAVPTVVDFALDAGGQIVGRVFDAATGRGLPDQIVAPFVPTGLGYPAITDDLGRYATRALAPGTYTLYVEAGNGYRRLVYGLGTCDFSCQLLGGTQVVVGTTAVTIDLGLQRGGRITGRTLSATTGTPVASPVQLYQSNGVPATGVTAQASGAFASTLGLPAGDYNLVAQGSRGYVPYRLGGGDCFPPSSCGPGTTNVTVSGAGSTTSVDLSLTQAGRLAGRLSTPNSPAGGVSAQVYSASGAFLAATTADANGLFQFPFGLPAGTYYLRSAGTALGYTDRIYSSASCTALACNPANGTPINVTAPASTFVNFNLGLYKAVKGDFDRNQQTDLVLRKTSTNEHIAWEMNGTTVSSSVAFSPSVPGSSTLSVVGVDDFDSDGYNDLVLWDSVSGAVQFWLMQGTTVVGTGTLATPPAPPWRLSATADFTRDGTPDLVWRNFATQKIEIWRMSGLARASTIIPTPDQAVDLNWEIVATLDMNGDGYVDFVWYNPTSGKIVAWFLDGSYKRMTGMFTTPPNAGDNNWRVVAGGDYGVGTGGRPGTMDLVWRNATSGNLVVWHMNQRGERTTGTFTTPTAPSPALDWTVVGPR